jgi:hypothetical protein
MYNMKISNRLFENVTQFKYLGTAEIYQKLEQEEIKSGLN